MKRFYTILLSIALSLFFTINFSCDGGGNSKTAAKNNTSTQQTTSQQTNTSVTQQNQQQNTNKAAQEQLYTFRNLNFAIWFPEQPKVSYDTIVDSGYKVDFYSVVLSNDDHTYMVEVAFYPGDALKDVSDQDLLTNVMKGFLGSINTEPTSFKFNTVQGRNGLIYSFQANGGYYVVQNVINGSVVYQILIGKLGEKPTDEEINQFIGSFRFLS